jgi:hypothetical protein
VPPISDALSTLSDRGLRRLLGARTFLRGLEYFRRRVVDDIRVNDMTASGIVRATDSEPYPVSVELTPDGIKSHCSCPAFTKAAQHCKHVAALLISVRDQARGSKDRREPQPAPTTLMPQTAHAGGDALKRVRRRDRRARISVTPPMAVQSVATMGPSGSTVTLSAPAQDATARQTGIGAWLPPEGVSGPRRVEFRLHVRQGALTVTVLDAEARIPVLPSAALAWQSLYPTPDRDALRLLARFESGNPRHPAVDVRGEDVAELLPLLEGQKVLLEPALMQLRFGEDPLRPRFDLETVGGDTIIVKASFERHSDRRRFSLLQGGWFEGWPGWHIDTQEGIARRTDKRVSPAALRRLLRSPTIGEPMSELPRVIMQGLPKIALEVGAELPELSQIADVVDLVPTFRMRAGGALVEAHVSLFAAYGDEEMQVRADGITLPIIVQPPEEGMKRARCIRVDIAAQQDAAARLSALGLRPDETGQGFVANGDAAIRFWSEGLAELPEDWDLFVPEDLVDTHVRQKPIAVFAKVTSGMDWLNVKLSFETEGVGVDRDELRRCLAEGKKYVRLDDGSFAPFDPDSIRAMLDREVELMTWPARAAASRSRRRAASRRSSSTRPARRSRRAPASSSKSSAASRRSRPPRSPAPSRRRSAPTRRRASRGSSSSTTSGRAASWPTTWASERRSRPSRSSSRSSRRRRRSGRSSWPRPASSSTGSASSPASRPRSTWPSGTGPIARSRSTP